MNFTYWTSFSKRRNSTKIPSGAGTVASCVLKEDTSIMEPVIILQGHSYFNVTYAQISDFGRYYFVTDITAVSKDVLRLSLHVDVLMSWATEIRANTVVIERQEKDSASNTYLSDHELKLYNEPYVETYAFTNSFTADNFVLAVAGSRT